MRALDGVSGRSLWLAKPKTQQRCCLQSRYQCLQKPSQHERARRDEPSLVALAAAPPPGRVRDGHGSGGEPPRDEGGLSRRVVHAPARGLFYRKVEQSERKLDFATKAKRKRKVFSSAF